MRIGRGACCPCYSTPRTPTGRGTDPTGDARPPVCPICRAAPRQAKLLRPQSIAAKRRQRPVMTRLSAPTQPMGAVRYVSV